MMFTEEIPKDLSLKSSNSSETEEKNNINNNTDNEVMDNNNSNNNSNNDNNSIDLSVKKTKDEESVSDSGDKATEPMEVTEVTLDLSMPSSSVNTTNNTDKSSEKPVVPPKSSGTNRRTQQLSHPQQIRNANSHWSSSESASPDVQMSDEETPLQMTNGNHINGYLGSDDSASRADADEDLPLPPSPQLKQLTSDELRAKEKKMRRLKQDLRNEEMKLVLLKKLRQSQLMKENIVTNLSATTNPATTNPTIHSAPKMVTNPQQSRNGSIPTSLPTSTINMGHNRSLNHHNKSQSVLNPPFGRNQSLSHGQIGPPLGMGQRNSNSSHSSHIPNAAHHSQSSLRPGPLSSMNSMNRTPVTTPPNVVLGYPVQELRAQQQNSSNNSILNSHQSMNHMGLATGSPQPNSSEVIQTPAQRQAAAKLALRKQLEKTLLQIPPPKPPPPEMHFIPNANNQEFVYYLGLETVVDFLTDSPNQNRPPPDPFECVQCGTDFTPVWKWQDRIDPNRDRPAVICESCVTSNIKKALKAEHTNRLKTAFVKALQQEQEIEQRIASGATSPPLPSISPPQQQTNYNNSHQSVTSPMVSSSQSMLPQAPPAHTSMPRLSGSAANAAAAAAAVASSAALLQQMPKLSAAHQSLFAAQAQQLHQLAQSLPQPQPAHMLPFAPLLAAQAYSYSMLGKSAGVPSSDLHRQYLLDMIPPRSLPQGSINWKT